MDLEFDPRSNTLISIGGVSEKGHNFYSLVRGNTKLCNEVVNLTGITNDMLNEAPHIMTATYKLRRFIRRYIKTKGFDDSDEFYFYGDADLRVLKEVAYRVRVPECKETFEHIINHYHDLSVDVVNHFKTHQPISLIKVLNYYSKKEITQSHIALDDALLLKRLYMYLLNDASKGIDSRIDSFEEYRAPTVVHKIKRLNKDMSFIEEYPSINKAVQWIMKDGLNLTTKEMKEKSKKNNISIKLKQSYTNGTEYVGYRWELI